MLSQSKIQHSFHRALTSYNDQAIVQRECAETLLGHIIESRINTTLDRVFEFGCGTGFLTNQLTERLTINELIVNDLVEECQTYLPLSKLSFIDGDIDNIRIPQQCDLICSASCVQWSNDLPALINQLTIALNKDGYLAISSFAESQFHELTLLKGQQSDTANRKLNYWSQSMWRKQLEPSYHIELIASHQTRLWFNSVKELLQHLRLTGVNGSAGQIWNKQDLIKFENDYRNHFEVNGKVSLTYEPIYIIGKKKT